MVIESGIWAIEPPSMLTSSTTQRRLRAHSLNHEGFSLLKLSMTRCPSLYFLCMNTGSGN